LMTELSLAPMLLFFPLFISLTNMVLVSVIALILPKGVLLINAAVALSHP